MIYKKIAVILYGPPGSGKGTQANLIANKFHLMHFDTGRVIEAVVHDPKRQKEKIIQKERKNFDTGILTTPSFALREVVRETKTIAKARWGIIYSGSPRTMYEAKGLLPVLEKSYGKKNVYVIVLKVPPEVSIDRNGNRLLCSFCKSPLLSAYYPSKHPKYCPVCGGPFYKRTLDNPEVIKVRLNEYRERTEPIFDFLKKRGYNVHFVDGTPKPFEVFQRVCRNIEETK